MNEFEKKIRNKLLMRGFPNKKLINNRGLIGATIDEVILEVVKNIGVTRCCETFQSKEVTTFEERKKDNYIPEIKLEKTQQL